MRNNTLIQDVIAEGFRLMQTNNVTDDQFYGWLNYSKSALMIASNNPVLFMNYNSVINAALTATYLQAFEKLSMCLRYLIGIQVLVDKNKK